MELNPSLLEFKNYINYLLKAPTAPEDVDCGSQIGSGEYHSHSGAEYCHQISREHGNLGRPREGAIGIKEPPGGKTKLDLDLAFDGWRPPVDGVVANLYAIPELGNPISYKRNPLSTLTIEGADEEQEEFIKKTLQKVPAPYTEDLTVVVDEKKGKEISEVNIKDNVLILNKMPHAKSALTPENIQSNVYHQIGHTIWPKAPRLVQSKDARFYRSAKSKSPRAFITNLSKMNEIEWFCEFFMEYIMHPNFTWIRHPQMYSLMKNEIFATTEYRSWSRAVNPGGAASLPGIF